MESKVYLSPIPMQEQLAMNLEQAAKLVGVSVPIMLRLECVSKSINPDEEREKMQLGRQNQKEKRVQCRINTKR